MHCIVQRCLDAHTKSVLHMGVATSSSSSHVPNVVSKVLKRFWYRSAFEGVQETKPRLQILGSFGWLAGKPRLG